MACFNSPHLAAISIKIRRIDIKLTAKAYTDEMQLPIQDPIKGPPKLLDSIQIRALISGAEKVNACCKLAQ